MSGKLVFKLGLVCMLASGAFAQYDMSVYPPEFPEAKEIVYKTIDDVELKLYLLAPKGHKKTDKVPAIVFFFGGGFSKGTPAQFQPQCNYLAERGMVAITADYRVSSRHNSTRVDCVNDGISAMRYIRTHAVELGIDPARIVASGASAGGTVAACVGVIPGIDNGDADQSIPYLANAMVLFNPVSLGKKPWEGFSLDYSPYAHVSERTVPSILFFGEQDAHAKKAKPFQKLVKSKGGRCEIRVWDGVGHGFFNQGKDDDKYFNETNQAMDNFLVSLGYLK
ncbi:alpha/beta hydrolase [Pontiella sulfatireligans]|uniref:Carboxylesterase NlhH n=1 Tax=Pontiella sulfatireligans TaxID=2750658 RepID=A0A6C2UGY5_9BACT|nr:alpha/beta hydrolase fold domain-containing protein [Pontiella sulfatireligans]VGO19113.1 Carboxylesterase NlhH [Pontiella sulfatireligans]